jgi:hypothetical protein
MAIISLSPAEFMMLGLEETRRKLCHKTKVTHFRSQYGASPESCSDIFVDIQRADMGEYIILKPNAIYFLMTLYWLHKYPTEIDLARKFNICEKTARRWIWTYAESIQKKTDSKVSSSIEYEKHIFYANIHGWFSLVHATD